jgi:uncharacterized membrane protein YfcA
MGIAELLFGVVVIFLAAIVRGFSGFGFSLLAITALSFTLPLEQVIPSVFLLEIAASIHMLPGIWRDIHWKSLLPIMAGTAIGTPAGLYALTNLPAKQMSLAFSAFVIGATLLLWKGYSLKTMPSTSASTGVGAAAGLANGAFGLSGPIVILFYFASPAGHIVGRASIVAFFLVTDSIGVAFQAAFGLINTTVFVRVLTYLPALLVGVWIGMRFFKSVDVNQFRNLVLILLGLMAAANIIKTLVS